VYVNGQLLQEPYVPDHFRDRSTMPEKVIGPGRVLRLGDHRSSSNDSRQGWTVARANIYGKAVFAVLAARPAGNRPLTNAPRRARTEKNEIRSGSETGIVGRRLGDQAREMVSRGS
jgi:hypothetical protein